MDVALYGYTELLGHLLDLVSWDHGDGLGGCGGAAAPSLDVLGLARCPLSLFG